MSIFSGNQPSKKLQLSEVDIKKIGKGALIAVAGALIVYVSDTALSIDFGEFNVVIAALLSIAVNAANKYLTDNK